MYGLNILPFRRKTSSFESLIDPYFHTLYRLAYRLSGSREDAEDLVQELLVNLYPKYSELKKIEALRPWLARSLYNLYIDSRRRAGRSALDRNVSSADDVIEFTQNAEPEPETATEHRLQAEQIQSALEHLSEAHRELIIFHDMEGYTLPELARIMNQPLGTLKSRLHRARTRLRSLLGMEPLPATQRVNG